MIQTLTRVSHALTAYPTLSAIRGEVESRVAQDALRPLAPSPPPCPFFHLSCPPQWPSRHMLIPVLETAGIRQAVYLNTRWLLLERAIPLVLMLPNHYQHLISNKTHNGQTSFQNYLGPTLLDTPSIYLPRALS